jgi:hypothetical protein
LTGAVNGRGEGISIEEAADVVDDEDVDDPLDDVNEEEEEEVIPEEERIAEPVVVIPLPEGRE